MFEYELRCNLRLPQISFLKQSEAMSACVQSKNEKRKGEGRDMIVSLVEYCSLPCVRQCTCGGVFISSLSLMRCVRDGVYVPCN